MNQINELLYSQITDDALELFCRKKRCNFINALKEHSHLIKNTKMKEYSEQLFNLSTKFNILEKY